VPATTTYKPRLVVPRTGRKGKLTVTVTCRTRCRLTGALTLTRATARKLDRKRRRIVRINRSLRTTRARKVGIRVPATVRRSAKRHHVKRLTVRLTLTARTADGKRTKASRTVRIRL
jgi:hypothetical protein